MTTITVYAAQNWDMADSYGLIACMLARHISALGVRVNAVGLGETVLGTQPEDIRAVTSRPISPSLGGIVMGYPTNYKLQSGLLHCGPRIAITMFESTVLPDGWVDPLNDMDAVIVPSWFCADVFKANGMTAPIHVVPLGVGEIYRYAERTSDRPLTFLTFLDRGLRKGGIAALQAFIRAFGEDTNYRLIMKGRDAHGKPLLLTNSNIEVVQQDMSEAELYELYCRCDVLINPHKGEGFGLLPREFAATGGISLTTNWSGTADGLGEWGWALPYTLTKADWKGIKNLEGKELGDWAEPDVDGCAYRLLQVAERIDSYRIMARVHAANAQRMYSWRAFAEQVLAIWKGVQVGERHRLQTLAA